MNSTKPNSNLTSRIKAAAIIASLALGSANAAPGQDISVDTQFTHLPGFLVAGELQDYLYESAKLASIENWDGNSETKPRGYCVPTDEEIANPVYYRLDTTLVETIIRSINPNIPVQNYCMFFDNKDSNGEARAVIPMLDQDKNPSLYVDSKAKGRLKFTLGEPIFKYDSAPGEEPTVSDYLRNEELFRTYSNLAKNFPNTVRTFEIREEGKITRIVD